MSPVVAFVILFTAIADAASESKCPPAKSVDNFDISQIGTGELFELGRYLEDSIQKNGSSAVGNYELNGDTANFILSFIENKKRNVLEGKLSYDDDLKELIYSFIDEGEQGSEVKMKVICTDNKNMFTLYSCMNVDASGSQNVLELFWILSRSPAADTEMQAQIDNCLECNSYIDKNRIKWNSFLSESCDCDSK